MFCDPELEFFDRVSAFEPQALPSFDFIPPPLFDLPFADFAPPPFDFDDLIFEKPEFAKVGENCDGFNEFTG